MMITILIISQLGSPQILAAGPRSEKAKKRLKKAKQSKQKTKHTKIKKPFKCKSSFKCFLKEISLSSRLFKRKSLKRLSENKREYKET